MTALFHLITLGPRAVGFLGSTGKDRICTLWLRWAEQGNFNGGSVNKVGLPSSGSRNDAEGPNAKEISGAGRLGIPRSGLAPSLRTQSGETSHQKPHLPYAFSALPFTGVPGYRGLGGP